MCSVYAVILYTETTASKWWFNFTANETYSCGNMMAKEGMAFIL
jgi:hypothetical protein